MLRLLSDEDFNRRIVKGLRRRVPEVDIVRVQDIGMRTRDDPDVLEWASREGRVVVSHDVSTMSAAAYDRVRQSLVMPGVIEVPQELGIGRSIDELELVLRVGSEEDLVNQVIYLPL